MPRKARIDIAGAVHHLMVRGIARSDLFYDHTDKDRFIDRLERVFTEGEAGCYAFALLSNHIHLLVTTGTSPLSLLMRRLLTGYAVSFNKRHMRSGHLFQNRYKSMSFDALCEHGAWLFNLDPGELLLPGKYPNRVAARSTLSYFLVWELNMPSGRRI